jgi:hypothetical protein
VESRRRLRLACILGAGAVLATVLTPAVAADAAWSVAASASAAGAATVMPGGGEPDGYASGSSVVVSWGAADLGNGTAVAGYLVDRYNATTGVEAPVGAGCAGVVTATSCTEDGVPAGQWVYTDTPVQASWTGAQSPQSPIVTVSLPT